MDAFRAYAAHMRTNEFAAAIADLLDESRSARTAVMCSETVWWRCHRRLIADHALLVAGHSVRHLFHDGRLVERPLAEGARLVDAGIVYDATA